MGKFVDLTGCRFGRLTVLRKADNQEGRMRWHCICDCGNTDDVATSNLKSGHTKSCGCLRADKAGDNAKRHGQSSTALYNVWCLMKRRCYKPKASSYNDYGGRGIKVCDEWLQDFQAFYDWAIRKGYRDGLTIDRIDNDGNYEPLNCRWVDMKKQSNNRRSNHVCDYKGTQYTLAELAALSGVNYDKLKQRITKLKWPVEKAVETP